MGDLRCRTLVWLGLLFSTPAFALSVVTNPSVSVKEEGGTFVAVSISGSGFGSGSVGPQLSHVEIDTVGGEHFAPQSNDASVVLWQDDQIVVQLDTTNHASIARVVVGGVESKSSRARRYALSVFDTFASGAYGPGYIYAGPEGRLWVGSEPLNSHFLYEAVSGFFGRIYFPQAERVPPDAGPFWSLVLNRHAAGTPIQAAWRHWQRAPTPKASP